MAGPSGLKLGGLVEGMCPNVLMKEFFRSVNGRGKMAANRQDFSHGGMSHSWGKLSATHLLNYVLFSSYASCTRHG